MLEKSFETEGRSAKGLLDFRGREILAIGNFSGRDSGPNLIGSGVFGEDRTGPKDKAIGEYGRLIEDDGIFMDPDITAKIFVLPVDAISFLGSEQGGMALMTVLVGVYTGTGAYHAPWADMDGPGIVEDGEAADHHVGVTSGGLEYLWGQEQFAFVDIGVGSAAAFLERGLKFQLGLGGTFESHGCW